MNSSAYQAILADLARDLEDSEVEEFELRRVERYLVRKLKDQGTISEPEGNGDGRSRGRASRLDLLDAVRHDLAGIERVLDELRILDTRARRLSVRPSVNGHQPVDDTPDDPLPDTSASTEKTRVAGSAPTPTNHSVATRPAPEPEENDQLTTIRLPPGFAAALEQQPAPDPEPKAGPAPPSGWAGSAGLTRELITKACGIRIAARGDFSPAAPAHSEPVDLALFTRPAVASGETASLFVLCRGAESAMAQTSVLPARGQPAGGACGLGTMLNYDTRLAFSLAVAGISIRMPRREIIWTAKPAVAEYRIAIPASTQAGSVIGKLTVVQNTVPIGRIAFQWRLLHVPAESSGEVEPSGQACRFQRAYLCYAPADRYEVQRRVPLLKAAGIQPVEDNLELDASQRWARGLYRQIDGCDVLFLFWSPAAADSAWLQKEWQYGLKRHGGDFILPVVLDGELPSQLSTLHANSAEAFLQVARSG